MSLRLVRILPLVFFLLLLHSLSALAVEVIKSPNDNRQYQSFVLPNQLKVLLISDPDTDKAAAAMDVHVGSAANPADRQGLAHFLEHMLFLGTKKYPKAGEYQAFIDAHGGSNNAFTAFEHTNFFFDINSDSLQPALDRFSQFFVAPLLDAAYVEREKHAVYSEYQARLKQDSRRIYAAIKHAADSRHPYSRFAVGSLATLADRPGHKVRADLVKFYRAHYSSNLMALVVLGKEPLPVLHRWVADRFAAVPNRQVQPVSFQRPIFNPEQLPRRLDIVPLKDQRILQLSFQLPPELAFYHTKPSDYLSNLIGHEGRGSLLSLLKHKGWADGLSAGAEEQLPNETLFTVSIQLTEQGLAHVDEVTRDLFSYVRMLKEAGPNARIYDEMRRIAALGFRFMEKGKPSDTVRSLAHDLQYYPPAEVLKAPYLMDRYDADLIRRFLVGIRPDNMLQTVIARGLETVSEDPWYGTGYRITPLAGARLASWQAAPRLAALHLPAANRYIPEHLALKPLLIEQQQPERILMRPGFALWHQQDEEFKTPRADYYFTIRSPLANDTPTHSALTRLFVIMVDDELNEATYPATLAGLGYQIYPHIRGFSVRISGYDDKQALLLDQIVAVLKNPELAADRFTLLKKQLQRELRNTRLKPPYQQNMAEISKLMLKPQWQEETLLKALQPLTVADLRAFSRKLLARLQVVALAHGNVTAQEALAESRVLQQDLLAGATPVAVPRGQVVALKGGADYVRDLAIAHPDSSLTLYYQGRSRKPEERAAFALLAQTLSSPFYHELRTQKQLGYIVFSTPMPLLQVPGLALLIQSPVATPQNLEVQVDDFLRQFRTSLADMGEAGLERNKAAVLTRLLEVDKTLISRSNRYWQELDRGNYHFDTRERIAAALRGIKREQLLSLYDRAVLDRGHRRLVIRSTGTRFKGQAEATGQVAGEHLITDPQQFKQGRSYFSSALPEIPPGPRPVTAQTAVAD